MKFLFVMPGEGELTILFIVIALAIIPYIFFLITLQKTLNAISAENQKMSPGNVWLMLIPLFNIVWQFIVVNSIADSIKAECERLNIPIKENKPTSGLGLAWNISTVCFFIPFASLASLVLWILYWVKVNEFKNLIITNKDNYMLDAEKQIFNTAT
ncbi:MAG: hypothetical protein H0W12_12235 [Chitinophagaceae bacterium]|nr:hypothetical protein [Chitinophagaceae bacterium]